MTKSYSVGENEQIANYVDQVFLKDMLPLEEIRERAEKAGLPPIHVCSYDGRHLEVLARMVNAAKIVEIGTLAGYSGVCLARALPDHGKLYTFEISPENAAVSEESFKRYEVNKKTKIYLGPALDNLKKIENEGPFDVVFIDADKGGYPSYAKWAVENLRIGGIIIGDNTFGFGKIADLNLTPEQKPSVFAIREFNQFIAENPRLRSTLLPTGEGLTLAVKIK
jgi:caffeoyl-CoA O-methyltransferase